MLLKCETPKDGDYRIVKHFCLFPEYCVVTNDDCKFEEYDVWLQYIWKIQKYSLAAPFWETLDEQFTEEAAIKSRARLESEDLVKRVRRGHCI